jgi:hypothetical protein
MTGYTRWRVVNQRSRPRIRKRARQLNKVKTEVGKSDDEGPDGWRIIEDNRCPSKSQAPNAWNFLRHE